MMLRKLASLLLVTALSLSMLFAFSACGDRRTCSACDGKGKIAYYNGPSCSFVTCQVCGGDGYLPR